MWDYKALPLRGSEELVDHRLGASYSYDRSVLLPPLPDPICSNRNPAEREGRHKRLLVSYDTQAVAIQKAQYISQNGLGGAMWWELDADAPEETGRALVRTVRDALGDLERRENELAYPRSSKCCVIACFQRSFWPSSYRSFYFSEYDNLRTGMQ